MPTLNHTNEKSKSETEQNVPEDEKAVSPVINTFASLSPEWQQEFINGSESDRERGVLMSALLRVAEPDTISAFALSQFIYYQRKNSGQPAIIHFSAFRKQCPFTG